MHTGSPVIIQKRQRLTTAHLEDHRGLLSWSLEAAGPWGWWSERRVVLCPLPEKAFHSLLRRALLPPATSVHLAFAMAMPPAWCTPRPFRQLTLPSAQVTLPPGSPWLPHPGCPTRLLPPSLFRCSQEATGFVLSPLYPEVWRTAGSP